MGWIFPFLSCQTRWRFIRILHLSNKKAPQSFSSDTPKTIRFIFNSPKHPRRGRKSRSLHSSPVPAPGKNIMKSSAPSDECEVAGVSLKEASEKCYLCWATCSSGPKRPRRFSTGKFNVCVYVCAKGERVESFVKMPVGCKARNALAHCVCSFGGLEWVFRRVKWGRFLEDLPNHFEITSVYTYLILT